MIVGVDMILQMCKHTIIRYQHLEKIFDTICKLVFLKLFSKFALRHSLGS